MEVVATVAGDAGVPDAGDEGVEGEAAVVGEIVRTHTGSSGGVERLGRTRAELAHSPPMAVAAVDSAETKATGTTKSAGPPGSEARRGRTRGLASARGWAEAARDWAASRATRAGKRNGPKRFGPKPRLRFKIDFPF